MSPKTYDEFVATLKAHISPKTLIIAERLKFHNRFKSEIEKVNDFAANLKNFYI